MHNEIVTQDKHISVRDRVLSVCVLLHTVLAPLVIGKWQR